jgi:(2Fe-2S) ferredoxin
MSYYKYHVFICTNRREGGEKCCDQSGAGVMREYAKSRVKELKLAGPGGVRVNSAGCMDRCEQGPVMVIYPDETWYTFVDQQDIDEIIREHLVNGRKVQRLLL